VRVIGGSARSVPLYEVRTTTTRAMTDRVKTSLFSVLDPRLPGAHAVDLFAGAGSIGVEALSRGAASCIFVESDRACLRTIQRNLERTRLADRAEIIGRDAWRAVRDLAERGPFADIVFLDPPFRYGKSPERARLTELAARIADGLLLPNALLVYHHEFDTPGDLAVPNLAVADQRRYGRNIVTLLRRATPA